MLTASEMSITILPSQTPKLPGYGRPTRTVAVRPTRFADLSAPEGTLPLTGIVCVIAGIGSSMLERKRKVSRSANVLQAHGSRRDQIFGSMVAVGTFGLGEHTRAANQLNPEALAKAKSELQQLIKSDPNKAPTLVRLAWHSSGTYDKMSKTGGSGLGTIRFTEELKHGGNAGLDKAVAWLEPLKKSNPAISYADLYTLSGIVAIKSLGGPDIPWRAGRVDSLEPKDVTPDGRLPNADNGSYAKDAAHIREVFNRMGFDDKGIVALSGAHALGRCHSDSSGFVGPWSPTPTVFNNAYFTLLKNVEWEEGCIKGSTCNNHQYRDKNSQQLMMLPTDIALIQDPEFKKYVDFFASDQKAFFQAFSQSFSTLLELGTKGLYVVA